MFNGRAVERRQKTMTEDNTKDLTDSAKLNLILAKLGDLDTRLTALETQGTGTTRPLLDQIIHEMVTTRDKLIERHDKADARLDRIERQLKVLTQDVMQVRTDQQRLDDRMDTIERRPN
jgi:hypothetical protein